MRCSNCDLPLPSGPPQTCPRCFTVHREPEAEPEAEPETPEPTDPPPESAPEIEINNDELEGE